MEQKHTHTQIDTVRAGTYRGRGGNVFAGDSDSDSKNDYTVQQTTARLSRREKINSGQYN